MEFIDQSNIPKQAYKDYRDESQSKKVMADCIRNTYKDIFSNNEYAYKLDKSELASKLKTLTGASDKDKVIPSVAGTFMILCGMADFEGKQKRIPKDEMRGDEQNPSGTERTLIKTGLGISYTINLNLPATTEIEVFNAIFKSLKHHILEEIEK